MDIKHDYFLKKLEQQTIPARLSKFYYVDSEFRSKTNGNTPANVEPWSLLTRPKTPPCFSSRPKPGFIQLTSSGNVHSRWKSILNDAVIACGIRDPFDIITYVYTSGELFASTTRPLRDSPTLLIPFSAITGRETVAGVKGQYTTFKC